MSPPAAPSVELPVEALGRLGAIRWAWLGLQAMAVAAWAFMAPWSDGLVAAGVLLAVGAASNVALAWARPDARWSGALAGGAMMLDALLLTGLLAVSGGATTPLSAAYLVHVVLAALLLSPAWTAAVVVTAILGYGALFLGGGPASHALMPALPAADGPAHHAHAGPGADHDMTGHYLGMWATVALVGPFVAVAISGIRAALTRSRAAADEARTARERDARLAALGTLAAGAAHELATPLATIAVAAAELERKAADRPALREDARLVREEVARCRGVLAQLAADVGAGFGELDGAVPLGDVVDVALEGLEGLERVDLRGEDALLDRPVRLPRRLVGHALRGLVINALQASDPDEDVIVAVEAHPGEVVIRVEDRGVGMAPEVLARAREPFFTTKGEGGTGLGLFVAASVVERLGGRLDLESFSGSGTRAALRLPSMVEAP